MTNCRLTDTGLKSAVISGRSSVKGSARFAGGSTAATLAGEPLYRACGYTLIELAIVVAVLGIMLGFGLQIYTKKTEATRLKSTQEKLDVIEQALADHVLINGFLPCPANPGFADNAPNFGVSTPSDANGDCTSGLLTDSTGMVPTRTLLLGDEYSFDGWGRRFTYRVAGRLASLNGFADRNNRGDISVTDMVGNELTGISVTPPENFGAAYVVISHGQNGRGAWARRAAPNVVAPIPTGAELQNYPAAMPFNRIYIQSGRVDDAAGGVYFDDITRFKSKIPLSKGEKKPVSPIRIWSRVCQDARAIVDGAPTIVSATEGIAGFNAQLAGAGDMTLAAATAIDRLCSSQLPALKAECPNNLILSGAGFAADCECTPGQFYFTTFGLTPPENALGKCQ
ncbi:MAG: prepilin-type N-terminal cleavage/methylation domain-containing protein [Alphaproteobacteria bacterium]|nr:prepilin-type N-terminal cleavage/methylation domain-containing protein [Alphaproteobacteria bacterium]